MTQDVQRTSMTNNGGTNGFSPLLVTLGQRLRERRKKLDLTQIELARRSKLHRTYVADVERGARNISMLNVERLALALETTLEELFGAIEKETGRLRNTAA